MGIEPTKKSLKRLKLLGLFIIISILVSIIVKIGDAFHVFVAISGADMSVNSFDRSGVVPAAELGADLCRNLKMEAERSKGMTQAVSAYLRQTGIAAAAIYHYIKAIQCLSYNRLPFCLCRL